MLDALVKTHAVQCGYCFPGMVLSAVALLDAEPDPDREAIKRGLAGNLCRCTGYAKIIDEVSVAAAQLAAARISLGSVGPVVFRAGNAEAELAGKALGSETATAAAIAAMAECSPIDDLRASAAYRRRMVGRIMEYQLSLAISSR